MKHRHLEETFRRGKPLVACLCLPSSGVAKVTRSNDAEHGLRVDCDDAKHAIGVEITSTSTVDLEQIIQSLVSSVDAAAGVTATFDP